MGLYAFEEEELIHASFAKAGIVYWCPDCFGPVKRRTGRMRFPHFYHVKGAPSCRLYSKTQDHLLAQIQLQREFPDGALQLERPFIQINRIADVCFEKEKIVFEIQCSPLSEKEAESRLCDYRSIGYETVWLLDDKRYNKRVLRPAEEFLRRYSAYYLSIRQGFASKIYDQFEIFSEGQRVERGKQMIVDLQKIYRRAKKVWKEDLFPKQIIELNTVLYFHGDRLYRAMQNHSSAMLRWRGAEIQRAKIHSKTRRLAFWFHRTIGRFYAMILEKLLRDCQRIK